MKHHIKNLLGVRPWTRHSLVLMVAGLVYVLLGIDYMNLNPAGGRYEGLIVARGWLPLEVWGAVWIFSGTLAIISSRWPPIAETWGYVVLTGLAAGWSATYATGVIFVSTPTTNLSSAGVWGMVAFMWWAISGLVNPDKIVVVSHGPD